MPTTIEVSDDTWTLLNRRKGRGESFDDVIQELLAVDIEPADVELVEADGGEYDTKVQISEQVEEKLRGEEDEHE